MTSPPTIHLTNWATVRAHARRAETTPTIPGLEPADASVGAGPALTIMAAPRRQFGEGGEGSVPSLIPLLEDLRDVQHGRIDFAEYRERYRGQRPHDRPAGESLAPGELLFRPKDGGDPQPVPSGSTLCCSCSVANAKVGRCHRVWAARLLADAGWTVVLDGRPLR